MVITCSFGSSSICFWVKFACTPLNSTNRMAAIKAKTNKKGTAKITIKKKVLKKLKVGKKVKYQVKYGKKVVKRTAKVKK